MTQALALAALLRDAGHEVDRVWLGTSPHRAIPGYFLDAIDAPVHRFQAPVQVPGRARVAVSPAATLRDALARAPAFLRGAREIHLGSAELDLVVNFMDLVAGVSRMIWGARPRSVAVGHNYLFLHPDLHPLPGSSWAQRAVLDWTRATAAGCARRLALSFAPRRPFPSERIEVVPPLLRPGLHHVETRNDGFLLAYALNPGYGDLLAAWQRARPDVRVRCYLERGRDALTRSPGPGFEAVDLDQETFLTDLGRCSAFVGSAGFEATCEAFYLGKPVLAVPTAGQYEQRLNAWDAERHGAARAGTYDDLDRFWNDKRPPSSGHVSDFRAWVAQAPTLHLEALERASRSGAGPLHSGGV